MTAYDRPPITEAVIEFRVRDRYTADAMQQLVAKLRKPYPNATEQSNVEVAIEATGGAPIVRPQIEANGYKLSSEDQADIVLLGNASLATARLAPYPGWEAFTERAQKNWKIWRKSKKTNPVNRIGLRYINRVDIPHEEGKKIRLGDYMRVTPNFPKDGAILSDLSNYVVQVNTGTRDKNWDVTLTSTPVNPPPLLDHASLLLDIDIFRTREMPTANDHIWEEVERIHALKNEIFEMCITDQSRRLFGQ